ncbi:MAG: DUF4097 family beta strand repeat-containing protein [Cyclobacteriaceae bacterium]
MKNLLTIAAVLICTMSFGQTIIASAKLEAKNIKEVRVEGSFCDVYVGKGDRNYLDAIIRGKGDEGDYEFDTDISGSTLIVKVIKRDRSNWRNWNMTDAKIELTLKDGVRLDIENSSGDVYVTGLETEDSEIEATSGDITLKRITANLEVGTSSGDISINQLVGELEIESTSGDQEIYNTTGDIDSRASSGDLTISDFEGDVVLEATSGDIDIRGGEGTVSVRTSSGNIDGNDIKLTGDAYFKATSGNIEIEFENDLSELSFDLTATSGDLDVGSRSAEKKLYIDRGGFKVVGVTSSGDQEYD